MTFQEFFSTSAIQKKALLIGSIPACILINKIDILKGLDLWYKQDFYELAQKINQSHSLESFTLNYLIFPVLISFGVQIVFTALENLYLFFVEGIESLITYLRKLLPGFTSKFRPIAEYNSIEKSLEECRSERDNLKKNKEDSIKKLQEKDSQIKDLEKVNDELGENYNRCSYESNELKIMLESNRNNLKELNESNYNTNLELEKTSNELKRISNLNKYGVTSSIKIPRYIYFKYTDSNQKTPLHTLWELQPDATILETMGFLTRFKPESSEKKERFFIEEIKRINSSGAQIKTRVYKLLAFSFSNLTNTLIILRESLNDSRIHTTVIKFEINNGNKLGVGFENLNSLTLQPLEMMHTNNFGRLFDFCLSDEEWKPLDLNSELGGEAYVLS